MPHNPHDDEVAVSLVETRGKNSTIKNFKTLSVSNFLIMKSDEIRNNLKMIELNLLIIRIIILVATIVDYLRNNYLINSAAKKEFLLEMMSQTKASRLSKDDLIEFVLRCQDIMRRSPIKPGCRFFEALFDEYILEILLEWLDIKDLSRFDMALLNHINRRYYMTLLCDTEHKGVLSVSESYHSFDSGVGEWLESRNVYMRGLKFYDGERDIPVGFLARTGRQLQQLTICFLSSDNISSSELSKLVGRCPNLQEVDMGVTDEVLSQLGESCSELKSICLCLPLATSISDIGVGKLAKGCRKLEQVILNYNRNISDISVASLANYCDRLHTIDLSYTNITDEGLASLGKGCKALKSINISNMKNISDKGVCELAERCPKLENVNLQDCDKITDISATRLAKHCPKLHTVNFASTQITDYGLDRLGQGRRTSLKWISLSVILTINDEGINKLADKCPTIECILLGGCAYLTNLSVCSIAKHCHGLQTLDISYTWVDDTALESLGEGCKALKTIGLNNLDYISDIGVVKLAESCQMLEVMTIINSINLSWNIHVIVANSCSDIIIVKTFEQLHELQLYRDILKHTISFFSFDIDEEN